MFKNDISITGSRVVKHRTYIENNHYLLKGIPKGRPGRLSGYSKYHWPSRNRIVVTDFAMPGIISS
jgi:hypothetical protein